MKWFLLISCLYCSNCIAEELKLTGRLFFSPKERAELDRLRLQSEQTKYTQNKENTIPIPNYLKLKGFIKNNQGKNIIWLDNNLVEELSIPGLRVDISNVSESGLPVHIVNGDKQLQIKPGQRLDTTNGQIMEFYREQNIQNTLSIQIPKQP
jgi:hypothetical protein